MTENSRNKFLLSIKVKKNCQKKIQVTLIIKEMLFNKQGKSPQLIENEFSLIILTIKI